MQREALTRLKEARASHAFQYVIIDEYQDTNTIQEDIIFTLASGHKNLCVVGDDDQALYRFRGATVENFVQFPQRCKSRLKVAPTRLVLATNYRSRPPIVSFYKSFMDQGCDWTREDDPRDSYRVEGKAITAARKDPHPAVIKTDPLEPEDAFAQIADLVVEILSEGKVEDPNQIAFLFPSLKSTLVPPMEEALKAKGLKVYAPRAGTFLKVKESRCMLGLFTHVFGRPMPNPEFHGAYEEFHKWLDAIKAHGRGLCGKTGRLPCHSPVAN